MGEISEIKWLDDVEDKDYPSAQSYLSLLHTDTEVIGLIKKLKDAKVVKFKAKDILGPRIYPYWVSATPAWKKTEIK